MNGGAGAQQGTGGSPGPGTHGRSGGRRHGWGGGLWWLRTTSLRCSQPPGKAEPPPPLRAVQRTLGGLSEPTKLKKLWGGCHRCSYGSEVLPRVAPGSVPVASPG